MIAKNTLKKIKHSFGRFISLVAIILIGVGFYAGIRQSTPAIRDAENRFVKEYNMMDLHLISTLGFTEEDLKEVRKLKSVDLVTAGYSKYVYEGEDVIRVLSIDSYINRYLLWEGNLPTKQNECLADSRFYKVGDVISIKEPVSSDDEDSSGKKSDDADSDSSADKDGDKSSDEDDDLSSDEDDDENVEQLTEHKFIVSGVVTSPIYMGTDYGSTNIGNGELKSYILVKKSVFDIDAYTDLYVTMRKTDEDIPYSDSYNEKLEQLTSEVEAIQSEREKAREDGLYEEAKETALEEVAKRKEEIEAETRDAVEEEVRAEIDKQQEETKSKLKEQAGKFGMTFENFIGTLSETVQEQLSPLTDAQVDVLVDEQMDDALDTAMEEAESTALEEIEIPECKWFVRNRNDEVANYKILSDQYEEVDSIADIIPIFFIVIVILMTSNTMSRMIAEERGEMGTLTSLGYSNASIIGGYMIYVFVATIVGVVAGYFIGVNTLPQFVFNCFPISVMSIVVKFSPIMFFGSLAVSFILMTGVTIFSCMKELIHKPAYLMRPVPPKRGKKLLLERVTGLWKRMTFSWKTTLRNIARYQRRVLMTVVGVGGCTFLMFIGFALRDCTSTVGNKQFDEIHHYDVMVILSDDFKSFNDIEGGKEKKLKDEGLLKDPLMLRQEMVKVENSEGHSLDVYLQVPDEENALFEEYYTLREADPRDAGVKVIDKGQGEKLTLPEDGAIITPRIASILGCKVGDTIQLVDDEDETVDILVSGVTENYVSNYVYMSKAAYKRAFRHGVMYNSIVAKNGLAKDSESDTDIGKKLSKRLYKSDDVASVTTTDSVLKKANESIKGLDAVVVLLVVIASLLAFTVLYNLTAISISERTREIATLKVLGFTPVETNDYIYRETIISSIIGIVAGLAVGPYLHGKVMDVIAVDNLVFLRELRVPSFLIAACLAMAFTLIMMLVTFIKLFSINMIESLKSVD